MATTGGRVRRAGWARDLDSLAQPKSNPKSNRQNRESFKRVSLSTGNGMTSMASETSAQPTIGIIMGSDSDLPTMQGAIAICEEFEVPFEVAIVSAHRTPERMMHYATSAHERGLKVIIAGAGGAAHLPGMVAAMTPLPVIGVPVQTRSLQGVDSLYSIVQMPAGIPVATVAIGNAKNAGLLAVQILASHDFGLMQRVQSYRQSLKEKVMHKQHDLDRHGYQIYLETLKNQP